jgi:hypothetical protein
MVDAGEINLETQTRAFKRRFTTGHFSFHLKQNVQGRIVRRISRELWNLMPHIDPHHQLGSIKLTCGSQWWSVTRETYCKSKELIEKHPEIVAYFKKIECSDESFFGTIFYNVSHSMIMQGTTYVKWRKRGRPMQLTQEDILSQQNANQFLFARKVRSKGLRSYENLTF